MDHNNRTEKKYMSPEKMKPINPLSEIIKLLDEGGATYRIISHTPVYTSAQAEAISGLSLNQGAKVMLLRTEDKFVLAVLPGDKRVDFKKVSQYLGAKKVGLATEEEVKGVMHCDLGACYPFGSFIGIRTIADPLLKEEEIIAFNPGVNDQTIIMGSGEYFKIAVPEVLPITK